MFKHYLTCLLSRTAIVSLVTLSCADLALAQSRDGFYADLVEFADLLVPDGTRITLGVGPELSPDYFGSDEYEIEPDILFAIRLGQIFRVGNDGAALNILGLKGVEFGPVVRTTGGRNERENAALTGLGNIGTSLDLGVYAKVNVADYFSARIRYYHAVVGGGNGGLLDLTLTRLIYQQNDLSIAMSLRASWAQKNRAEQFFGISAQQSADSGLPEYSPGASFQDLRVNIGARWQFDENWSLNGFARFARLLGDIVDSPIVRPLGSPNQFTLGSYIAYSFNID